MPEVFCVFEESFCAAFVAQGVGLDEFGLRGCFVLAWCLNPKGPST